MRILFLIVFLNMAHAYGHPGIAIVKDSRGNIFYSDLTQVFKITNGKITVVVPNVHTHELYIDAADNLYGEHKSNDQSPVTTFYHYLWRLQPSGKLDTLLPTRQAFINIDYSLARDNRGNEYYIKQFVNSPDTNKIFMRLPNGEETVFAIGNFNGIKWLHPQSDGSILYEDKNKIYRVRQGSTPVLLAANIATTPTFTLSKNNKSVWGLWQDSLQNVYAAVFSDQVVKKISTKGEVSEVYRSKGSWTPTQGIFDNSGSLWLLETSDKNEMRVIKILAADKSVKIKRGKKPVLWVSVLIGLIACGFAYNYFRNSSKA